MKTSAEIHTEDGQSTTEYALIIALVSVLVLLSLTTYGSSLFAAFQDILNLLPTV